MDLSRNILTIFLGFTLCASSPCLVYAEDFDLNSLQRDVLNTIDHVRPAVVRITGRGSSFSGVIVSPDGHVLSVAHAVTPGAQYRITLPDGRRFRGTGRGSNAAKDCALVMINNHDGNLPHVPMGDSSSLVPNQPCIGLSFPGGQTAGTEPIVRFGRIIRGARQRGTVQSSALMEPGDSGGPLFDLNGYVIGIHSRIGRSVDRNYEVPVDVYRDFWNELNRALDFVQHGPPTPRLGVRCDASGRRIDQNENDDEDSGNDEKTAGLKIISVVENSIAASAGILTDDRIVELHERRLKTVAELRSALIAARDDGVASIKIRVQRGEESLVLYAAFDVERKSAPEVALPKEDHPEVKSPRNFRELAKLPDQLAELEDRLDEACVEITSDAGEGTSEIIGTRIQDTQWIISKSSAVGADPRMTLKDESVGLEIVSRDSQNDLVLLKAPDVNETGVELGRAATELSAGAFLLSPDEDGPGRVSVVSSPNFRSRKQYSRGYLGVVPVTHEENQGALLRQVVDDGAAKRAGLQEGDVVTKLNETIIRSHNDMREFLMQLAPSAVITATFLRDENELTKSITLGAVPSRSEHAANQMDKSERRDGFDQILPHDANLQPADCGGPLFNIEGQFVGVNIARNSRVRSYALPAAIVQTFVEQVSSKKTE